MAIIDNRPAGEEVVIGTKSDLENGSLQEGGIYYASDEEVYYGSNGTILIPLGGGGGGGDETIIKGKWKVIDLSVTPVDLTNGYLTLPDTLNDTKVIANLLGAGRLDRAVDFSVDLANNRINLQTGLVTALVDVVNKYGNAKIEVAYFAQ